ncbi:MAG: hypothetical protein IJA08_02370 [Clostridia bacterium]|nr:hypothetical protein [Clostridia bacterium]
MPRKSDYPRIKEVLYVYNGTNEEYNKFLRATIFDYLGHKFETHEESYEQEKTVAVNQ